MRKDTTIQIYYWHQVKLPNCPYENGQKFEVSGKKELKKMLSSITLTCISAELNLRILSNVSHHDNIIVIQIDSGRFLQT